MTTAGGGSPGPERFEANTVSLEDGVVLLEASAGTGKTFALAHLVLRLLAEKRLGLRELLVVTYTNAAAAELRDRIGRRLQQGLTGLQPPAGWTEPDPVLAEWLARQPDEPAARAAVQGLLLLALEELDAADITTIHGFCQRTLRRHAMEAARPPELTLESDATDLVRQVAHDYWRQQVLALPLHLVEGLAAVIDLGDLERLLLQLDGDPGLALDPLPAGLDLERPLAEQLAVLWEEPWARFRQAWSAGGRDLEQAFRAAAGQWRAAGAGATTPYAARPRSDRSKVVDDWLARQPEGGSYAALMDQKELCSYFHPEPFCRAARKAEGAEREIRLPGTGLLEAVAAVREGPAEAVLLHGCHWGLAELARRRARSGSIGFAQLLEGLDPGPDAMAPTPLLRAVGERYRAALIDEFQDTDPVQWRILRLAFPGDAHLLVMVGDPKQAIYRFRGGDLDTYRLARRSAARVLALQENRRSSPSLIESLNGLMTPSGLPRSGLPVPAVLARSRRSGPDGMAPVRLLWLGGERGAGDSLPSRGALEARLPALVADAVLELLEQAPALAAGDGSPPRPLRARDIALLVHNHRQAEGLRSALERRHIASRLVSKADVFASPAATALQRLLDALADPADPGRLRLLAASPLLGWSARRIVEAEPADWSELAGRLQALARELPHQGPLGVLARLVDGEGLARLSVGGRLLADLQQVAELLQERLHVERLALVAAADWLRRLRLDQTRAGGTIPESHQAHSDKADDAVTVITVHRSKGLEFPVVICPYLWQAGGTPHAGGHRVGLRWHPAGGTGARLDLHLRPAWGQGWQALRQHRDAERAERERLAYVAVTRAQHLLLLAWGPAKGQQANPLFPWLFPEEPLPEPDDDASITGRSDGDWLTRLQEGLGYRALGLELLFQPAAEASTLRTLAPAPAEVDALRCGPVPLRTLDTSWSRSSYTGWTRAAHGAGVSEAALDLGRDTSDPSPDGEAPQGGDAALWPEQGPLAGFARGAGAGDCLHRMLEQLDYRVPTDTPASRELVQRELRRAGLEAEALEPLLRGLEQVRLTPFGGGLGSLRVADLGPERRLNELSFDLSLGFATAAALAAAFADHPGGAFGAAYAATVERLPVASRGILTGSIDLIFTASDADGQERWWVADWKSNWLGRRDGEGRPLVCGPRHYGREAMATLMAQNHYPLQAHLYLVALHRYLAWRRPGYDPVRHLGGYAYVFLRGAPGDAGAQAPGGAVPGMFVERPPLGRLLALDAALGGHAAAGGGGDPA